MNISIILPVYNGEATIKRTLESIFKQTYSKIEIIIINDGSTDNSETIIKDSISGKPQVTYLKQDNQGLGAARNTGIELANSSYIGFIDADDFIDPVMYESLLLNIQEVDADIAICDVLTYFQNEDSTGVFFDRRVWEKANQKKIQNFSLKDFVYAIRFEPASWRKLYRRAFLKDNNIIFPEGLLYEDMPFHIECMIKAEKITLIDKPLYYYTMDQPNKLTSKKGSEVLDIFPILQNAYEKTNKEFISHPDFCFFFGRALKWTDSIINKKERKNYSRLKNEFFKGKPLKFRFNTRYLVLIERIINKINKYL